MSDAKSKPSSKEVADALVDLDFPASKDAVLEAATHRGASDAVIRLLRAIPPVDYESRNTVIASIDSAEASGQSASEKGRQALLRPKPGVAQHMRRTGT